MIAADVRGSANGCRDELPVRRVENCHKSVTGHSDALSHLAFRLICCALPCNLFRMSRNMTMTLIVEHPQTPADPD